MVVSYDPTGAAYSFSPIAFNGQFVQGLGATEDARWDNSLKYRVSYGPVHFGAMYKFADGNSGCNYIGNDVAPKDTPQICYPANNTAYQFNLGGAFGALDIDGIFGVYHDAVVIAGAIRRSASRSCPAVACLSTIRASRLSRRVTMLTRWLV